MVSESLRHISSNFWSDFYYQWYKIIKSFFLIEKAFKSCKLAFYDFHYLLTFKYDEIKHNNSPKSPQNFFKSFIISNDEDEIEFSSPNNEDMLMVNELLKTKMSLSGFHHPIP